MLWMKLVYFACLLISYAYFISSICLNWSKVLGFYVFVRIENILFLMALIMKTLHFSTGFYAVLLRDPRISHSANGSLTLTSMSIE